MESLIEKEFGKEFISSFKGDTTGNLQPRQTPGVLYSKAIPTPVSNPALIGWSEELANELQIKKPETADEIGVLSGNVITPSMYPYAARYAGHQFGNWAGQLGDGRAITLGEWNNGKNTYEMQLKGAGPTPYSRRADGRAVLRSSVREYLMSEAMHYLGVPTTRALSLITTGDPVMRDMFYDGHPAYEPGAIVMRVAPSFLRFGNFEMLASRDEIENLKALAAWTIKRFYPELEGEQAIPSFFTEVVRRTAILMTEWMRVGFVHGVMNTDNMSILGLTIDYGPYSFVDAYDPAFTPNTTDLPGRRYAFGRQAAVAQWNLSCLAGALVPLVTDTAVIRDALDSYAPVFLQAYHQMMGRKLGLDEVGTLEEELIGDIDQMMATVQPDMTIFYQLLTELDDLPPGDEDLLLYFDKAFYNAPSGEHREMFLTTIRKHNARFEKNGDKKSMKAVMRAANPRFILRNYLLHEAITDLEKGSSEAFDRLSNLIKDPYGNSGDAYLVKRPEWAQEKAGCSMLSCSS